MSDAKQLTPRIRLEHVTQGNVWRWAVTIDDCVPELFVSHDDAVTFARGVDIGHASQMPEEDILMNALKADAMNRLVSENSRLISALRLALSYPRALECMDEAAVIVLRLAVGEPPFKP